jgi:hypothetical protein
MCKGDDLKGGFMISRSDAGNERPSHVHVDIHSIGICSVGNPFLHITFDLLLRAYVSLFCTYKAFVKA